jgi:hypothetical protein
MGIFIRTVPNVMQHFGCSQETAQRYCDLRAEGHGTEQAQLMAGLSDPPEDEPEDESEFCGGCNPEPTISEVENGRCDSCGKALS